MALNAQLLVIIAVVALGAMTLAGAVSAAAGSCDPAAQQDNPDAYTQCIEEMNHLGGGAGAGSPDSAADAAAPVLTTRTVRLFNYRWSGDPGDSSFGEMPFPANPASPPFGAYSPQGNKARLQSDNVPLSAYLPGDVNGCAYQGTLASAGFDDQGWVNVGGADIARNSGSDDDCGGSSDYQAGSETFDPQTAKVSWFVNNKCNGPSGIWASVSISYRSQNGYAWDGTSCSLPVITGVDLNDSTPLENENVTLTCAISAGDASKIVPHSNASVTFLKTAVKDNLASFTFNVGGKGDQLINCTMGSGASGDYDRILRVGGLPDAPEIVGKVVCLKSGARRVNVTWQAAAGAASYFVYVNGVLNATTKGTNFTRGGFLADEYYNVSVAGATSKGQLGAISGNVTIRFTCPPPSFEIPDHFHRAYFARASDRTVTAFWNDDGAVIVYQNFVTDFSKTFPSYTLGSKNRQGVQLASADPESEADVRLWRSYTSGLRIDPRVSGTRPTT